MSKKLPLEGELNPNHPVMEFSRDQWHKVVAILIARAPYNGETFLDVEEIDGWAKKYPDHAVTFEAKGERIRLRIVSMAEGQKLADEAGGMPA